MKALHDPSCGLQPRSVNGIEMRDHVRPPGFSGLARNNETDSAHHAARDDGPALVAVEGEAVDISGRDRIGEDCVVQANPSCDPDLGC